MAEIKSALEIALEKTSNKKLTTQEIAEIKLEEKVETILAKYYKDQIEPDQLWHYFKELPLPCLVMAQNSLLRSLSSSSNSYDIDKRKTGFLAIENLKEKNCSSDIELSFDQMKKLQVKLQNKKDDLIQILTEDLERNPEKRLQPFQQGEQIFIKELSLEEIISQDKELIKQFNKLETEYKKSFDRLKEEISKIINKDVGVQ